MINSFDINSQTINAGAVAAVSSDVLTSTTGRLYTLELRNASGDLIAVLDEWISAQWKRTINDPDQLTLVYPGDSWIADYLTNPYEIWLYQGDSRVLMGDYQIITRSDTSGIGHYITIEADGALGKLAREIPASYTVRNATRQLIHERIEDLLALQTSLTPITLGNISSDLAAKSIWGVSWQGQGVYKKVSIKAILDDFVETLGGVMYVANNKLYWTAATSENNEGHIIRLDKNATQISRVQDWRGETAEITYSIGLINLSDQGVAYNFDARMMTIGKPVRLLCASPAIDISAVLTEIDIDLATNSTTASVYVPTLSAEGTAITRPGRRGDVIDYMVRTSRVIDVEDSETPEISVVSDVADLPDSDDGAIGVVASTETIIYIREDGEWIQLVKMYKAADKASLPSVDDGSLGQTTGTNKRGYWRTDGAWVCVTHLEAV